MGLHSKVCMSPYYSLYYSVFSTLLSSGSTHCGECSRVIIIAEGPSIVEHPSSFGLFHVHGSFWENMIPFFKSSVKYLTVHPYSNPSFDYMPWVVSDHITQQDLSSVALRTQDREGILCPWES